MILGTALGTAHRDLKPSNMIHRIPRRARRGTRTPTVLPTSTSILCASVDVHGYD